VPWDSKETGENVCCLSFYVCKKIVMYTYVYICMEKVWKFKRKI